jgi:1,4-dihydroxy-2-naphthoate octaprenyltransferase
VLTASLAFFGIAAIAGIAIVVRTGQWWMLLVGAACLVTAWFYTGGKHPYGYAGLGELFVFVFFGLVATVGTTYVQASSVPQEAWFGRSRRGSSPARCCSPTTCATSIRTVWPASARSRCASESARPSSSSRSSCWARSRSRRSSPRLSARVARTSRAHPGACAILIVWTYRQPRELVVALSLTSLTSLALAGLLCWAFVG